MNETPAPSPGAKALAYAESLGVHAVYEKLIADREKLDALLTEVADLRDKRRLFEVTLEDREMEILSDERGKHPDMSQAGMDRHLKVANWSDEVHRAGRGHLAEVVSELDGLQFDRDIIEADIKIGVARLTELGGYLQYLAAIKLQQINQQSQ